MSSLTRTSNATRRANDGCGCASPAGSVDSLLGELVRPRYFSGQFLTEDELTLDQEYAREKVRRHNRFLHGTGVVCGLDVTCSRREGYVTLGSGYALDGCGNDIFVPRPVEFNLLAHVPRGPDESCAEPYLMLRAPMRHRHAAGTSVVRMRETLGAHLAVDPDRSVPACGTELPVDDETAASLTAGQVVRMRDLEDASRVQYVEVAASGGRKIQGMFQFVFSPLTLDLRAVTLEPADDSQRNLVTATVAGSRSLGLDDASGIREGDVLRVRGQRGKKTEQDELVVAATRGVSGSDDEACDVYLYLRYVEVPDVLRRSVPHGACVGNGHCEHARVRETFDLRVSSTDERLVQPDLVDAIEQCVREMMQETGLIRVTGEVAELFESAESWDNDLHQELVTKFNELRNGVLDASAERSRCQARADLEAYAFPEPPQENGQEAYVRAAVEAYRAVYVYAIDTIRDCAFRSLLIDCPGCQPAETADILLARISVRDERIVDICTHPRRHVKTFPSIEYWFSPLSRAIVAPFNAWIQSTGKEYRELRGPSDLVEFLACELDFGELTRSVTDWTVPQIKTSPASAKPFVTNSRKVIDRARTVPGEVREKRDELREKAIEKRPQVISRLKTILKIQDEQPIEATRTVQEETGLEVEGTVVLERNQVINRATLFDAARALVTDDPVEIAYTRNGRAFLRTRTQGGRNR